MTPEQECRTTIARLELVSHAPAKNWSPSFSSDEEKGGNRPPGGIIAKDDNPPRGDDDQPGQYDQKSYIYFRKRLARCQTEQDYRDLARAAQKALDAWHKAKTPPFDSVPWQEKVAKAPGTVKEVAKDWNLSPSRVHQLRQQYKRAA